MSLMPFRLLLLLLRSLLDMVSAAGKPNNSATRDGFPSEDDPWSYRKTPAPHKQKKAFFPRSPSPFSVLVIGVNLLRLSRVSVLGTTRRIATPLTSQLIRARACARMRVHNKLVASPTHIIIWLAS